MSQRPAKVFVWISLIAIVLSAIAAAFLWPRKLPLPPPPQKPAVAAKPARKRFKPPTTLTELMKLSPAELDHCDIALMNLLCTQGLPGADKVKIPEMLATIDKWAKQVDRVTQMNSYQFVQNPKEFGYSEGRYRMMALVTVLDRQFNVHYNPALMDPSIPGEIFYRDSQNVFIHGLLGPNRTGTCSSMPILYIAVGRRLGYPLHLAEAKVHFFAQWDDGKDHFDIECTSWGYADHDDEHYRKWPEPITDDEMKLNRYLKPLSGAEELSAMLENRGVMLIQDSISDYEGALACYEKARELTPTWKELDPCIKNLVDTMSSDLDEIHRLNSLPQQVYALTRPQPEPSGAVFPPEPRSSGYVPVGMTEEDYARNMPPGLREQMKSWEPKMPSPDFPAPAPRRPARTPIADLPPYAVATDASDPSQALKQLSGYQRPPEAYRIPWYIRAGIMPAFVQQATDHSPFPQLSLEIH